ncbi:acetoin reductase [Halosaccharopolyspora lacisalsi]|nr:acetoin reductase [Halosaccharopolyspora lacisalsi]
MTTPEQPPRAALVTGAARGIGRGIALRLAADGLDVAVNDVEANSGPLKEVAGEITATGRNSTAIVADVSDADAVRTMVERTTTDLGQLDVMIANAGIADVKPLLETGPEDFDHLMSINLRGVYLCYTAAARQMIDQGTGGKIIGAASIVAHRPFPLLGTYSASKWGVRGLTQAAAMEWAQHGITVNAYCPGIVGTAMWDHIDEKLAENEGLRKGAAIEKYSELIHLGRVSVPEDVAGFVSYLASHDSDYMTGQSVMIDGGVQFA